MSKHTKYISDRYFNFMSFALSKRQENDSNYERKRRVQANKARPTDIFGAINALWAC
ncbi:MAG TPA: hypothetical protein PKY67_01075 [Nitrosomonas sp.]|nr:hypothetical protein [Nitrosomonas sp.]